MAYLLANKVVISHTWMNGVNVDTTPFFTPLCILPLHLLIFSSLTDRMMVLRHHPDKRRAAGEEVREDDDYFTCITKAYEILGDPIKRRSWDSVDPEFDDEVPVVNSHNKANFFQVSNLWGPHVLEYDYLINWLLLPYFSHNVFLAVHWIIDNTKRITMHIIT